MKLRIAFYLVLVLAAVGCATHSRRSDVLSTSRAVALRLEMDGNGVCSGTVIGPHLILSATHCFVGMKTLKVNDKDAKVQKQIDDGNDHTMLVVDTTFTSWARIGPQAKPGDVVFLWGQPAFLNFLYREGHVAGYDEKEGKVTTIYDVNGFFGDSGSGVFNEAGVLVAVTSYAVVINYEDTQFKLMGSIPIIFTPAQYAEAGYGKDHM